MHTKSVESIMSQCEPCLKLFGYIVNDHEQSITVTVPDLSATTCTSSSSNNTVTNLDSSYTLQLLAPTIQDYESKHIKMVNIYDQSHKQQKMISSTVILPESVNNNSCCKLVDLIKEHYDCTAATSAVTATKGCVWINDTFSIRQADDPFGRNFTYTRRDLTNNDISPLDTMPS